MCCCVSWSLVVYCGASWLVVVNRGVSFYVVGVNGCCAVSYFVVLSCVVVCRGVL